MLNLTMCFFLALAIFWIHKPLRVLRPLISSGPGEEGARGEILLGTFQSAPALPLPWLHYESQKLWLEILITALPSLMVALPLSMPAAFLVLVAPMYKSTGSKQSMMDWRGFPSSSEPGTSFLLLMFRVQVIIRDERRVQYSIGFACLLLLFRKITIQYWEWIMYWASLQPQKPKAAGVACHWSQSMPSEVW